MDTPQTPSVQTSRQETEQDYWTLEERRADRERRIAWRIAAALLVATELCNLIFALTTHAESNLKPVLVRGPITLFLAIFMFLDRKWAKNTIVIFTILGTIPPAIRLGRSYSWALPILLLDTAALLLILLGRPQRWQTVVGGTICSLFLVWTMITGMQAVRINNASSLSAENVVKLDEANWAFDNGNYGKARNLFIEVTETSPNSPLSHFGLCKSYLQGRSFALALNSCNKAIELNPKYVDPHSYRTAILLQLKRYKEAERSATETLALDERYSAYALRAEARILTGDAEGARADAEKALELAANDEQRASAQSLLEKLP